MGKNKKKGRLRRPFFLFLPRTLFHHIHLVYRYAVALVEGADQVGALALESGLLEEVFVAGVGGGVAGVEEVDDVGVFEPLAQGVIELFGWGCGEAITLYGDDTLAAQELEGPAEAPVHRHYHLAGVLSLQVIAQVVDGTGEGGRAARA